MAEQSRVVVAWCPHCGGPLRCRSDFAAQGISPKLHFTCKCGRSHSLGELTAVHIAAEGLLIVMQALEEYVAKHPQDREKGRELAVLLAKRGEAYAHHGELKKAAEDLSRACRLDPGNEEFVELHRRVADAVWGPAQIQEKIDQDDLHGAITMLFGYCARHPEDRGAIQSLAALFNRRAVQAANLAQKLKAKEERLDYDEGSFIRSLEQKHLLTTSEFYRDLERNPEGLLQIAIADAALAAELANDSSTASNFEAIRNLAKQFGMKTGDVAKIAERGRSVRPDLAVQPKRKSGFWSWFGK